MIIHGGGGSNDFGAVSASDKAHTIYREPAKEELPDHIRIAKLEQQVDILHNAGKHYLIIHCAFTLLVMVLVAYILRAG